ncbi:hypothetical protein PMKS-001372 [Pichia membranifaciens]|uniref:Ribosomal protein L1 n=1 Tax=Pichia membranifaciens TaxID=4926 RepID=A0A1Q2YEE8_9ASCO|nr:hypothetical protein PMKS-001372 [Pichia membranifaciens]
MPPRKTRASKTAKAETAKPKTTPKVKKVLKKEEKVEKAPEPVESESSASVSNEIVQPLDVKDNTIEKAVNALSQWKKQQGEKSSKKDLFETEDEDIPVYLQITAKKYLANSKVIKPRMLQVPHPVNDLEDTRVCLFVKDDLFDEDALARIEVLKEDQLKNLAQIITVKDLKTKYHAYEARRKLLSEYDVFLTDSSIANMIPKLLGKTFFGSSKFPLTISVTDNKKVSVDKLVGNFNKALNSVGYMLPMGVNMGMRLGMLGQDIDCLKDNIHAITKFLEKYPIRLIQLKLKDSPSLPLYITDKIYSDEDILKPEEVQTAKEHDADDIPLSIYSEGLKELGFEEEEASQLLGKKKRSADSPVAEEPNGKKSKNSKNSKK